MNNKGKLNQKAAKAKIKIFAFAVAMITICVFSTEKKDETNAAKETLSIHQNSLKNGIYKTSSGL